MKDWWEDLFQEILKVSLWNLEKIETLQDGSIEAMCLLVEAAENYQFIQQAYQNERVRRIDADVFFCE
jgi:hypothetical protein|tara:strand:- start:1388 stop:1591 length:204 start_codon:yes stop_codon:yes gene_type:complete